MLLVVHGGDRSHGVGVIWRGYKDGVNVLLDLVEHAAEVSEALGLSVLLECIRGAGFIHIAERHDLNFGRGQAVEIASALAAHANAGDAQFIVGRAAYVKAKRLSLSISSVPAAVAD
jgi:hypothetical protein